MIDRDPGGQQLNSPPQRWAYGLLLPDLALGTLGHVQGSLHAPVIYSATWWSFGPSGKALTFANTGLPVGAFALGESPLT